MTKVIKHHEGVQIQEQRLVKR